MFCLFERSCAAYLDKFIFWFHRYKFFVCNVMNCVFFWASNDLVIISQQHHRLCLRLFTFTILMSLSPVFSGRLPINVNQISEFFGYNSAICPSKFGGIKSISNKNEENVNFLLKYKFPLSKLLGFRTELRYF